jgi:hypothetical protein
MSAFFGNMMIALQNSISATTLSAAANATTTPVTATVSGGRLTYNYFWTQSGTPCTITSPTANSTTFTGSSAAGTTTVLCQTSDTITGNMLQTDSCTITWTAVTQNVVISGTVTYNGAAQSYTLTGTPSTPAPSGTPASFTNAGTYVYPTNITSITPGSGYTLGSVSGSFVINRASITAMSFTLNGASFTTAQSGTAGTSYTIAVSSTTPSTATNSPVILTVSTAGAYSLTSSGTGNWQGSFTSPVLTINAVVSASITQNSPRLPRQVPCSAILTGATATGYAWAYQSGSTGVTFSAASLANTNVNGPASGSSVVRCTISYSGGTQVPTTSIQWGIA